MFISLAAEHYHYKDRLSSTYNRANLDLTLFVSCYNEQEYIEDTLSTIAKAMQIVNKSYEIIIIDDNSKDQSVNIVKKFITDNPNINIILKCNKDNLGLAHNYVDAAFLGKGKYYRLICGDNAEPVGTLIKVLDMMGAADIIVPYYVTAEGKSPYRRLLSKSFTSIINFISGHKLNYYNGLQVHLRYNVMRWHPNTRGFGFQAGLMCSLLEKGFTYKEVPCITIERRGGAGNALNFKNLRSVFHIILSVLLRRLAPWR